VCEGSLERFSETLASAGSAAATHSGRCGCHRCGRWRAIVERSSAGQKTAFTSLLQKALGHEYEMEILDQRDNLPRQPGGKFEEFISRVS
jgi:hypothetical protein